MSARKRIKDAIADTQVTMCPEKLEELIDRVVLAQGQNAIDLAVRVEEMEGRARIAETEVERLKAVLAGVVTDVIEGR